MQKMIVQDSFSPKRAAYGEFYEYMIPISSGDLVINEILAINNNVIQDEFGNYSTIVLNYIIIPTLRCVFNNYI